MKINWGTGIAIFYTLFASILVMVVIKSKQYDHSLVVDNYYEEDLHYQSHFDKLVNSQQAGMAVQISLDKATDNIQLVFPKEMGNIKGNIHFFRPSDQKQDFSLGIELNTDNKQQLPANTLAPGLWKLQVDWQSAGKAFFTEQVLVL
ncbi:MAG: FixH family protein [Saprospiraceae bacterium]